MKSSASFEDRAKGFPHGEKPSWMSGWDCMARYGHPKRDHGRTSDSPRPGVAWLVVFSCSFYACFLARGPSATYVG